MWSISLLLLSLLVPQQGDPTVKDFKRYFKKTKDPIQRVEFIHSLEDIDDAGVATVLLPVLKDKDPAVADAAAAVIGQLPSESSRQPLLIIVEKGKPSEQLGPILRAASKGKWLEFLPLLRPHLEHKEAGVRLWAVRAVGNMRDGDSLPQVITLASADDNPLVRVAAIESLVQLRAGHTEECLPPLLTALTDEHTSVQVAGVLALRLIRHRNAIAPLVDLWQTGEGLVLQHIYPTLMEITDMQYGADPEQWQRWWSRVSADFVIPSDEKMAERRDERAKTAALYVPKESSASFAGISTPSREVVFVIDVSGSMEDSVLERDKFREAGHQRFEKMEIIKKELSTAIEGLEGHVRFTVHSFATGVHSWRDSLVPANALNKKSALEFVRKLKPIGGAAAKERASVGLKGSANVDAGRTNTHAALMAGLGVTDEKTLLAVTRSSAADVGEQGDTMFFFSDGLPTVGELVDTDEILAAINKFNEFRRISIHAIAIGDFKKTWMRNLALQNGGQFVDLGR
ncbi:MAG: HEAT repeat domain-containing protein [Planctomycetes bacterium]|nr:HEAT repeat domain-containing protein [Planctomycetota bacterium]